MGTVFLDLRKVFDTVDHLLLIDHLKSLGVAGESLELFRSYLSGRVQQTMWVNALSPPAKMDLVYCLLGNVDRDIGRHSGRQSVDSPSIVRGQLVDSRSIVRQTIGRVSVDISTTHLDLLSVRSYVGDISVNCRWYIGQLQLTVGGISVNCRSNISGVVIYQVSPMAFFLSSKDVINY